MATTTRTASTNAAAGLLGIVMALFGGVVAANQDPPATAAGSPAPAVEATDEVDGRLAGLVLGEAMSAETYDRDLFKHWIDADGNGCDTRQEVLIAESTEPVTRAATGCKVTAGHWDSAYDAREYDTPGKLDIDHMVPLAEAWRSGASEWTPEDREAYANDLDLPEALWAVSATSNRSKGDKDPASWLPPSSDIWCDYATAWVAVKVKWELTADSAEVAALRDMFATC